MRLKTWEEKDSIQEISLKSTHLNLYYNKSSTLLGIANAFPVEVKRYKKELLCLLTNALRAIRLKACALEVSRDRTCFVGNKQGISFSNMIKLQDKLEELDYIDIYSGGIIEWNPFSTNKHKVSLSYLVLKEPMLSLFDKINKNIIKKNELIDATPVVIRDRDTKELLNTSGVKGVQQVSSIVNKLNLALSCSDISIKGKDISCIQFFRSFIGDLSKGGRWYERGSKIQTKSQNERKSIMIDNESTVELDFKALHPSLLYEEAYKENPEFVKQWIDYTFKGNFDPYGCPLEFLIIDQDKIDYIKNNYNPKYNPVRNLCKYALMLALNAGSMPSATKALVQAYKKEYNAIKAGDFDLSKAKYYGIEYKEVFHGSLILHRIADYNSPIRHKLFSDAGVLLQNIDSAIMSLVIDKLVSSDEEVAIPEHDSVIVKKRLEGVVHTYMLEAYQAVVGSIEFCSIEVK